MGTVKMEKAKAVVVLAWYEDFDPSGGSVFMWNCDKTTAWKMAFYELWRWQMTLHGAYNIGVSDGTNGAVVKVFVKDDYAESLVELMEGVGFRKINQRDAYVGLVDCMDVPDDVEMIDIGWC